MHLGSLIIVIGCCLMSLVNVSLALRTEIKAYARADNSTEEGNGVDDDSNNSSTGNGPVEGTPEDCLHGTYQASTNCSQFIVCNQGNQTQGYCPPGFWFDPNYKGDMLCNHPEVVCAADNTVCDCAALYPPVAPDPLIETDVTCLLDNRFHFISSRVDCGRYFVCFNGNVQRIECKSGFQFDPKTETCDYPELVNCQVNYVKYECYKYLLMRVNLYR